MTCEGVVSLLQVGLTGRSPLYRLMKIDGSLTLVAVKHFELAIYYTLHRLIVRTRRFYLLPRHNVDYLGLLLVAHNGGLQQ